MVEKAAWGGRGGAKSHFFAELLVERCLLQPGTLACCIREIQNPGGGLIIFVGMQDQNAESIKSLEGYHIAWIEEAQTLSHRSLALLRPTIRVDGSEIWASWNPRRKSDAIDEFLRGQVPDNAMLVKSKWRDNPWFPATLEEERKLDIWHLAPVVARTPWLSGRGSYLACLGVLNNPVKPRGIGHGSPPSLNCAG
jgi:phage terminase large subunit